MGFLREPFSNECLLSGLLTFDNRVVAASVKEYADGSVSAAVHLVPLTSRVKSLLEVNSTVAGATCIMVEH